MRRVAVLAGALLLSLMSFGAPAGVVYRWQDLTINPNLGAATGTLEINDAYWQPNATVSLSADYDSLGTAAFGVDSFYFAGARGPGGGLTPVLLSLHSCPTFGTCATEGNWDFNLTFGSVLSGSFYANNTNSHVRMSSSGPLWTIDDFDTDGNSLNCWNNFCGGGTGLWVLDLNTVPFASPAPEPETWAMMFVGLAFVVAAAKRRRADPMSHRSRALSAS